MNKKFFKFAVALPAAVAAFVLICIFAFQTVRHLLVEENEALVHSVAQNILPALLVNDAQQVDAMMKALESYPGIQTAELVSAQGASIASYARGGQSLDAFSSEFALASAMDDPNRLHVMAPITFDSLILANLHIAVNLWPIYLRIMTWLCVFLIVPSVTYVLVKQLRIKVRFEKVSGDGDTGHGDHSSPFDLHAATSQAMADADISLEYQPIRRMSDEGLFGMEVVVCWRHPSGQTLHFSPANFASLAEKSGICLPFDTWLLRTVCEKSAAWQHQYGPLVLSLDVSETQFKDLSFPQTVRDVCEATQFPHQLLELEVRESILTRQPQAAVQSIQAFASKGLSVSVDGFGLMQSSLALLQNLPIHKVKLDVKLSKNLLHDAHIARLMSATILNAISNDVQVTIEGLESSQQCAAVQQMGCLFGQGAHFGQPLTEKDFETLLAKNSFEHHRNSSRSKSSRSALKRLTLV
jgi:EAL domain-containing protein (putative c-di-GMP-specific phosphodiesterase class I)